MTREETAKLLAIIDVTYPSFKIEDKKATLDAWHWALEEYPFNAIQLAYKMYLKTDKSGFAPSVNQLITNLAKPMESETMTEQEAWALVKKALKNGNYGAEEEFAKLPEIVQKVVGGASMIRQWSAMDSDEVNTVVASNFMRSYKIMAKREVEQMTIGNEMNALSQITQKLADGLTAKNQMMIETEV